MAKWQAKKKNILTKTYKCIVNTVHLNVFERKRSLLSEDIKNKSLKRNRFSNGSIKKKGFGNNCNGQ